MNILSKVTTGRTPRAQRVAIYAPEGFGKSTLASQFPNALFLDVEESTAQMDVRRLGREDLASLPQVEQALAAIAKEKPCGTVIIDTMDWLEQMVLDAMIRDAASDKIQGIEDFGYGKGYTILKERVTLLLAKFDTVIQAGIHVVLLAHAKVVKFEPPDGAGPFDRYEMKLSKQVAPIIKEWADMLIFGNWRTQVKERDKSDAGAQFKAIGGRERQMHCNRMAAWDAKNRHGLADVEKWDIATVRKGFEAVGVSWTEAPGKPVSVNSAENPTKTPETSARTAAPTTNSSEPGKPAVPSTTSGPPSVPAGNAPSADSGSSEKIAAAEADPIPGLAPEEQPDAELDRICSGRADEVNHYLLSHGHITREQSYRSMPAAFRARVLKNPAAFLKAAQSERRAA